ncbi:cytochrome P450 1A2-like [Macadamia integrifolia]|uniref:cytochrome P450 1A2-like n=1 Tax=Macadamia integrifolia TaxID=60698 RepID=UPI001C4EE9C9|nr:cytochrome P450 1A2-like [Macadamia integrifolia]
MERRMKNFIWAGEVDTSKPITVKWESVCKPKEEGGLGIRRLRDTNMAMLCKLVWRIKHEKSTTNSFLRARFVKKDGSFNRGCRPSSIALGISKVWKTVEANERWIIGRGDLANFWKDKWWGPRSILEEIQTPDLPPLPCNAKDLALYARTSKGEVKSIADIMCCRKLGLKIDNPKIVPPLEVHWSEFSVVTEAILVAMNMNARGLWIESDSAAVVAATQKMHIPWFVLQKWRFALPFLQSITWKITHCFHEANTVAEFLAKKAAKSGASDYSTTFPSHMLIVGGSETTFLSLTWVLSLLLNHPDELKKAQDELDVHVERDRHVDELDIKSLVYLQAIVKETLRLYSLGPILPCQAMEDCQLGGYHVPKGTRLLVNIWKLHRDPNVWSNLNEFRPKRFLTTHADVDFKAQQYEYIPFSVGRQPCLGITLATHVFHLALARVLHGFDVMSPLHAPVDMTEGVSITLHKARPLQVLLTPRLPSKFYKD